MTPDPRTNLGVSFGLSDKGSGVDMGVFLLDGSVLPDHPTIGDQNLNRGSEKMTIILRRLGWRPERIDTLKGLLQQANCENIASRGEESVSINFRYSGMGLFTYLCFNHPLSDSVTNFYSRMGDTILCHTAVLIYTSSL